MHACACGGALLLLVAASSVDASLRSINVDTNGDFQDATEILPLREKTTADVTREEVRVNDEYNYDYDYAAEAALGAAAVKWSYDYYDYALESALGGAAVEWFGAGKVHKKEFWEKMRGIGFSPADYRGYATYMKDDPPMLGRLDDALQKVVDNGFNMIRVWRTEAYQKLILEHIRDKSLDIKVQLAIDVDTHGYVSDEFQKGCFKKIDEAVEIAKEFPDLILGLSIGNENMASWMQPPHDIAYKIKDRAEYAKKTYGIPVTYNFVSQDVWTKQGFTELCESLDYINSHMYGAPIYDRWDSSYNVDAHFTAVLNNEAIRFEKMPKDKPIVIGETGWQLRHGTYREGTYDMLQDYYSRITRHIYGTPLEKRKAVSMFYFNLNNEDWKGGDDGWGLYDQGDANMIGKPGTGAPNINMTNVDEILKSTPKVPCFDKLDGVISDEGNSVSEHRPCSETCCKQSCSSEPRCKSFSFTAKWGGICTLKDKALTKPYSQHSPTTNTDGFSTYARTEC